MRAATLNQRISPARRSGEAADGGAAEPSWRERSEQVKGDGGDGLAGEAGKGEQEPLLAQGERGEGGAAQGRAGSAAGSSGTAYSAKFVSLLILVLAAASIALHLFKQRWPAAATSVALVLVLVALLVWASVRLRKVGLSDVVTRRTLHRVILLLLLVTASLVQVAIELALKGPDAQKYRLYGSIAVGSLALVLVAFVWLL
jgi:hypothetical protein